MSSNKSFIVPYILSTKLAEGVVLGKESCTMTWDFFHRLSLGRRALQQFATLWVHLELRRVLKAKQEIKVTPSYIFKCSPARSVVCWNTFRSSIVHCSSLFQMSLFLLCSSVGSTSLMSRRTSHLHRGGWVYGRLAATTCWVKLLLRVRLREIRLLSIVLHQVLGYLHY